MLRDCLLLAIGSALGVALGRLRRAYRESLLWKD
jgi:hypothetical protein